MSRCVIVTGASGGIGGAVVKRIVSDGFSVVAVYCNTVPDYMGELENVVFCKADIANANDREKIIATGISHFGGLFGLVNVAGVAPKIRVDLLDMSEESYDRVMEINTKGTLFLTQKVAREMLKNQVNGTGDEIGGNIRGNIVNISSISSDTSSVSRGEYCISKVGVSMITSLFADRLAGENILVNEICPGVIATEMTNGVKEKYDKLIADGVFPIKRWGTPEDVANGVSILLSGQLGYTTGESIHIDGGFHIRRL